jgi:hypothetical protein
MTKRSDDNDNSERRRYSKAEKTRLHRERVEALGRRQQQKSPAASPRDKQDDWRLQAKTSQARTTDYEDDFDDYSIEREDVLCLLRSIERNRQALRDAAKALQRYVEDSPGFAKTWREWNAAGGVTADDFERFLDDRMRYRPTKRKRHLRLIANNKPRPLLHKGGDDDAA